MASTKIEFLAAGGNRHPSAADWKPGLLAFGSANNIALWNPEDERYEGVSSLVSGHKDTVNAVKIYDGSEERLIISGGADKALRIWGQEHESERWCERQVLDEHQGSVNVISVLESCAVFVSGAADGTMKVWSCEGGMATLSQSIQLKPKFLPLTLALYQLPTGDTVLAVSGTCNFIQLYIRPKDSQSFELQATLPGHEGWIRSLDFAQESASNEGDILLASASQDKYVRLWRLHKSDAPTEVAMNGSIDNLTAPVKKSLSNKSHQVGSTGSKYNVTFEALLVGHEDWIYTAKWAPSSSIQTSPTLLSASADNSLSIWQADTTSGVWICQTRLGDISSQKGSTTATGSTGGFWIGLWQPDGQSVVSLGRTGSWRRWIYGATTDSWVQRVGISGHTQEVKSLAWSKNSSYLLSTSSDQTTRMWGEWTKERKGTWHEISRPQIHGYDLNCIDSVTGRRFISGADEKLLRVFDMPGPIDELSLNLSGLSRELDASAMPRAASIPVLGLSNKAVAPNSTDDPDADLTNGHEEELQLPAKTLEIDHPPLEDHLARHTLWPEQEKLYGHGYEISAVAATNAGTLVATACKASSLDHAVIRLYDCREWREVKPPLTAHSLTVTSLAFSLDGQFLVSVGRDRSVAVFQKKADEELTYERLWIKEKAHSRMILDCSWVPLTPVGTDEKCDASFVTAGRDKSVKIWRIEEADVVCLLSITAPASVTAVDCAAATQGGISRIAYGTEYGGIHVIKVDTKTWEIASDLHVDNGLLPSGAVNALRWRTSRPNALNLNKDAEALQLAVAGEDGSVRIMNVVS